MSTITRQPWLDDPPVGGHAPWEADPPVEPVHDGPRPEDDAYPDTREAAPANKRERWAGILAKPVPEPRSGEFMNNDLPPGSNGGEPGGMGTIRAIPERSSWSS